MMDERLNERDATIAAIRESLDFHPEPGDIYKQQQWLEFCLADIDRLEAASRTNMYGCAPCPKCKSEYRWPTRQGTITCDDCGHTAPSTRLDDIADDLWRDLCEGDGEHSERLDKALIMKHLRRVVGRP